MGDNLQILSLNCRGLGNKQKRLDIFKKLKDDRIDIALLQDTHWDSELLTQVKEEWDFTLISTSFTTRSRGTAILFRNTFEFNLGMNFKDINGNYCFTEIHLPNNFSFVIGSIYAPNQDDPEFIKILSDTLDRFENPNIILGGDWNSTRNFALDNVNYISLNHPKTTKAIDSLCETHTLSDGWRVNNPTKKQYTWLQGITNKQARLDFFLCSDAILSIATKFKINTKYRSDHAPITFNLITTSENRGRGTWKMNNTLLQDEQFITLIKNSINDIKRTYASPRYSAEHVNSTNRNLEFTIPVALFWETLLVTLRGIIINYSSHKKRTANRDRKSLERRIGVLDERVSSGLANITDMENLIELNNELIMNRKNDLFGALIRSRAESTEFGEKPSKYFLNLENKNRINKNISQLKISETTTLTKQSDILKALHDFYETLYSEQPHTPNPQPDPILHPKKLNGLEKASLELPLTKHELDEALFQMKNNKSPGLDGYSPEFFKKFWPQLGWFFLDYTNECFEDGEFSQSLTQGLITCIPKVGKARDLIKKLEAHIPSQYLL